MTDELPDSLERLSSEVCRELKDEVVINGERYKPIPLEEEKNSGGESNESPHPAQQSSALVTGPGTLYVETEDGWVPLGKIGPATTTAIGYILRESRQPETGEAAGPC